MVRCKETAVDERNGSICPQVGTGQATATARANRKQQQRQRFKGERRLADEGRPTTSYATPTTLCLTTMTKYGHEERRQQRQRRLLFPKALYKTETMMKRWLRHKVKV